MALNFPDSPTTGDEFTGGGFTWVWTGSTWSKVSTAVSAANDFALLVGASGNTTYVLDRTYSAGRYTIDFVNDDITYDIYFVAEDGTYAGYTNGTFAQVSAAFAEVVVIGASANETVLFNYQGSLTSPTSTGDVAVAGAFINSVVTASLPNVDDTTVVNGGNFAADVQVSFIGQDTVELAAKSVVRTSSTELLVTRPDAFDVDQSPYTVKVINPGIPAPTGTNAHLLADAVTAGTNPVWITVSPIYFNIGSSDSITLVAEDTEGSDIDYTIFSGTLPAGLSLDSETGVISGTHTGTEVDGDVTTIVFTATDAGGNFLNKSFDFTANAAPVWVTAAGALLDGGPGSSYSVQLEASTGTTGGALSYSLQSGALPDGLTLSSTGLISGTNADLVGEIASFTVRVTDSLGLFVDRAFTIETVVAQIDAFELITESLVSGVSLVEFTGLDSYHSTYDHLQVRLSFSVNANDVSYLQRMNNNTGGYASTILESGPAASGSAGYYARNIGLSTNSWYYHQEGQLDAWMSVVHNVLNFNEVYSYREWNAQVGESATSIRQRTGFSLNSYAPNTGASAVSSLQFSLGGGNPPGWQGRSYNAGRFSVYGIKATQ